MQIGCEEGIYHDYLKQLSTYPLLTQSQEKELLCIVKRFDKTSVEYNNAFNTLVTSNLRLVVSIVRPYANGMVSVMDLIQDGTIGLITAIEKFNVEKGLKLSTYATWWIRQAVQKSYQKQVATVCIPQFRFDQYTTINTAKKTYYREHGTEPTCRELAEMLGDKIGLSCGSQALTKTIKDLEKKVKNHSCSAEEYSQLQECKERLLNLRAKQIDDICHLMEQPDLELDSMVSHTDDGKTRQLKVSDVIPDPRGVDPELHALDNCLADELHEAINSLPQQERYIFEHRYGINGAEKLTLKCLAADCGISIEKVRQIQDSAVREISHTVARKDISPEAVRRAFQ